MAKADAVAGGTDKRKGVKCEGKRDGVLGEVKSEESSEEERTVCSGRECLGADYLGWVGDGQD